MKILHVSYVFLVTCWLLVSFTNESLASEREDPRKSEGSPPPSRWGRFRRRLGLGRSSKAGNSGDISGGGDSGSGGSSEGSDPNDAGASRRGAAELETGESGAAAQSLSTILAQVEHGIQMLTQQVNMLGDLRGVYLEIAEKVESDPSEGQLRSLEEACTAVINLRTLIKELADNLRSSIQSSYPVESAEAKALLMKVEEQVTLVLMDEAAFLLVDEWCLSGQGSEDRWGLRVVQEVLAGAQEGPGHESAAVEDGCSEEEATVPTDETVRSASSAATQGTGDAASAFCQETEAAASHSPTSPEVAVGDPDESVETIDEDERTEAAEDDTEETRGSTELAETLAQAGLGDSTAKADDGAEEEDESVASDDDVVLL